VLTHAVDLYRTRQAAKAVYIGEYSYVGTNCVLLSGSKLPARSILGAGSVLTGPHKEESHLYRGNPAIKVRRILTDRGFFVRKSGFID
jgi:acetyltransferase-like isoleucine patch superfamily enzyme